MLAVALGGLGGEADPPPPRQPLVATPDPPAGLAAGDLPRPRSRPIGGWLALHCQPRRRAGPASVRRRHLMGLLPTGLAQVWVLQLACLILALPLYYFALGVSWRRYHRPARHRRRGRQRGLDPHQRHHPVASPPARREGGRAARRALRGCAADGARSRRLFGGGRGGGPAPLPDAECGARTPGPGAPRRGRASCRAAEAAAAARQARGQGRPGDAGSRAQCRIQPAAAGPAASAGQGPRRAEGERENRWRRTPGCWNRYCRISGSRARS